MVWKAIVMGGWYAQLTECIETAAEAYKVTFPLVFFFFVWDHNANFSSLMEFFFALVCTNKHTFYDVT